MPVHRKNSCKSERVGAGGARWFVNNRDRQRKLKAIAKASRTKQHRRNKGK